MCSPSSAVVLTRDWYIFGVLCGDLQEHAGIGKINTFFVDKKSTAGRVELSNK
jgi:hypothetical protein